MRGSERSLVRHPPAPRRGRSRGRRSVPSKALCRGRADLEWTGRQRPPTPGTGGEWPLSYRPALTPRPGLELPAQRVGKILDVEGMAQRIVDMNASGGGRPVRGPRSRDVTPRLGRRPPQEPMAQQVPHALTALRGATRRHRAIARRARRLGRGGRLAAHGGARRRRGSGCRLRCRGSQLTSNPDRTRTSLTWVSGQP